MQSGGRATCSLLVALLAFAALLTGCAEHHEIWPSKVEYRLNGGSWTPIADVSDVNYRFQGRGELTVRVWPPAERTTRFAAKITNLAFLHECDWSGAPIYDGQHAEFPVLTLPPGNGPLDLHFELRGQLLVPPVFFGDPQELVDATIAEELPNTAVGGLMVLLGAGIGIAGSAFRRKRRYAYLGVFSLGLGTVFLYQSDSMQAIVLPLTPMQWLAAYYVASYGFLVSFALFVDDTFGESRDRFLRALVAGTLTLGLVVTVATLTQRLSLAWISRVPLLAVLILTPRVLWLAGHAARRGDRNARTFFWGFAFMIALAIPDIAWGLGHQFLPFNTSHFGGFAFVVALAGMLESHERTQGIDLAARLEDLGRANAELRRQIVQRSKELAEVLQGRDLKRAKLSVGSMVAGRYEILRFLGQGGMGSVFEAVRVSDGLHVALKVMAGDVSAKEAARFVREAEIAARLEHPSLLSVYDVGLTSGAPYLVMALATDGSLADQAEHFGDADFALPLLAQIASGLAALHEAGVVHRDLKPANVLLERECGAWRAKIADFGIARMEETEVGALDATAAQRLTATGAALGTPLYMAPEMLGGRASAASDMFAFGAIAFEMLTGELPYEMPPIFEAIAGKARTTPKRFVDAELSISETLATLLDATLSSDEKKRPRASAVEAALDAVTP